jgi:hypothetical protein
MLDLIVTLDDATSAIYSAFLVEEEGTASTFRALEEVFGRHGLPLSLYTDRGSHYFHTATAGGAVAHGAKSAGDDAAIDPIAVADEVARSLIPRKCLRYLTRDPFGRGIFGDVDPRGLCGRAGRDEGIEQVETDSWNTPRRTNRVRPGRLAKMSLDQRQDALRGSARNRI